MDVTTQYAIVLAVYFGGMLWLGFRFSRRHRTRTDYFLARGKLGAGVIGFSYSATQLSGSSYMGAIGTERIYGYNFTPGAVSSAAAPWFTYVLLGDRLRRIADKVRCNTLVDVLAARYPGAALPRAATVIMLAAFAPLVAAQMQAAATAFEALLGMPYLAALLVFGLIVIIYTVTGGMHAVAWTDFVQGALMIVGFAVLAPVAIGAAGGLSEMHRQYGALRPGSIGLTGTMPASWVVSTFLVWGFFQIGGNPASVTRFLIPEDDATLKKALVYSITFTSFIYVSGTLIAIAAGVLIPNLDRPDLALPTLVGSLLPPIVGGVVVAAILGAIMSTIDSVLLLAGSLVVENLWLPTRRSETSEGQAVRVARGTTLGLGLAAMVVAIDPPAPIYWVVTMAFSLMTSAFTFPLLLGLWWPRATHAGALAGMLGGGAAAVLWYVASYLAHGSIEAFLGGIWPALVGPAVSLLLTVTVSRATPPPPAAVTGLFFGRGEAHP